VLAYGRERARATARTIGVYPETKHPSYFRAIGLPLEDSLLAVLARHGYRQRGDAVFIQSFEVGNLEALRARTTLRLVQLVNLDGVPPDVAAAGGTTRYADLITRGAAWGWRATPTRSGSTSGSSCRAVAGDTAGHPHARCARGGTLVHVWTMRWIRPTSRSASSATRRQKWRAFAMPGWTGCSVTPTWVQRRCAGRTRRR
jgi:glycerophosphoryl diester phosphodiesterase